MPAHTFFDHIVVTPSGQTPPSLFEPLQERPESIDYRKQQSPQDINATKQAQWTWNIADTYSMAFSTSNIDLPSWSLLDVPQLSDLKLSNFIGTSVLRFVMYENLTPREKGTGHLQQHIRYSYAIQVRTEHVQYCPLFSIVTCISNAPSSRSVLWGSSRWRKE